VKFGLGDKASNGHKPLMVGGSVTEKPGNRDLFGRYGKSRGVWSRGGLPEKRERRGGGDQLLFGSCWEYRPMGNAGLSHQQKNPDSRHQALGKMGHGGIFVLNSKCARLIEGEEWSKLFWHNEVNGFMV